MIQASPVPDARGLLAHASPSTVLVLTTVDVNLLDLDGNSWDPSSHVSARAWDPTPEYLNGLHGLLWGEGHGHVLDWTSRAIWVVVEVESQLIVPLADGDGVKFPRGRVRFMGSRRGATRYLLERAPGRAVVGADVRVGDFETAAVGYCGTASAGVGGTIQIAWWAENSQRLRVTTGYVGEGGIEPNVPYRCDCCGVLMRLEEPDAKPPRIKLNQPAPGAEEIARVGASGIWIALRKRPERWRGVHVGGGWEVVRGRRFKRRGQRVRELLLMFASGNESMAREFFESRAMGGVSDA